MRALVQRVTKASVAVAGETAAEIGPGLVVLLGVSKEDDEADAEYLVEKTFHMGEKFWWVNIKLAGE